MQGPKVCHFTFLVDSISNPISSWDNRIIFQLGKLMLINVVLMASLTHILSIFMIPKMITNKVEAMLA